MSYPEFFFRKYIRKHISTFDTNNSGLIKKFLESKLTGNSNKRDYIWKDLNANLKEEKSKTKFTSFYNKGTSEKQFKVLRKIIKICKQNNIKIIFIKYPLAPSLENIELPDAFSKERNIYKIENSEMIIIKGLSDQYFSNQDHVNKKGAKKVINKIISLKH